MRRYPMGAEVIAGIGVHFRVWAPNCRQITLLIYDSDEGPVTRRLPMERKARGYYELMLGESRKGLLYRFELDEKQQVPDPASRYQPKGPHGPSAVVDPSVFQWSEGDWRGIDERRVVLYEMHVGTFTEAGTWSAAERHLPRLRELGITVLEVMPVAEFPGRFGWGYDGVQWFAPTHSYGTPDDLRAFVNAAHREGLGVILDVVYNHLGPDGNYLNEFSQDYFTDRYKNEWGAAMNFDGESAGPVRELVLSNVAYWIEEFRFDGLRLDATQQIFDASPNHILAAIARRAGEAAGGRRAYLVGENEPQNARLLRGFEEGGYGLSALWNDDFHHTATVALKGSREAYYRDYGGTPQEFISSAKYGFLYQGQWYSWQRKRRGTPTQGIEAWRFVNFLENHDQVANSLRGERMVRVVGERRLRAMTGLLCLLPGIPMLFQGQEFAASTPFRYFADHGPELAKLVEKGRKEFVSQFPSIASAIPQAEHYPPHAEQTFRACRLDYAEHERNAWAVALHRDLLALRRVEGVFGGEGSVDGAVLGPQAFLLRYFATTGGDRLLVVNLGSDLDLTVVPEPLLAPPENHGWTIEWSSEAPVYGGGGVASVCEQSWVVPGQTTLWLKPVPLAEGS